MSRREAVAPKPWRRYNLPAMKRLALVLLILMLPLQFCWAGVSAYCKHESGTAAQHFGHHDHQHQKSIDTGDDGAQSKAHPDCGYCHFAHSYAVPPSVSVPVSACNAAAIAPQHNTQASFVPEGPDRPNWMHLA